MLYGPQLQRSVSFSTAPATLSPWQQFYGKFSLDFFSLWCNENKMHVVIIYRCTGIMNIFLKLLFLTSFFMTSSAYAMHKNDKQKTDLVRNVSARKFRGEYSVELEFKTLAELAMGNSLNKTLIDRYRVAKTQFEREKETFSKDEFELCVSRIAAIEEGIDKFNAIKK